VIAACTRQIVEHPAELRYRLNRSRGHSKAAANEQAAGNVRRASEHLSAMHEDLDAAMASGYPAAFGNKTFSLRRGEGVRRNDTAAAALELEYFYLMMHAAG
jgi:hypothetical protein